LGRLLLRNSSNPARIAAVTLLGSVQFFAITNLPSWWVMYAHSLAGLAACYTAAIPFFGRTLLGDFFYVGVLFSAYAVLSRRVASERLSTAA
jgi:hypothetical protein